MEASIINAVCSERLLSCNDNTNFMLKESPHNALLQLSKLGIYESSISEVLLNPQISWCIKGNILIPEVQLSQKTLVLLYTVAILCMFPQDKETAISPIPMICGWFQIKYGEFVLCTIDGVQTEPQTSPQYFVERINDIYVEQHHDVDINQVCDPFDIQFGESLEQFKRTQAMSISEFIRMMKAHGPAAIFGRCSDSTLHQFIKYTVNQCILKTSLTPIAAYLMMPNITPTNCMQWSINISILYHLFLVYFVSLYIQKIPSLKEFCKLALRFETHNLGNMQNGVFVHSDDLPDKVLCITIICQDEHGAPLILCNVADKIPSLHLTPGEELDLDELFSSYERSFMKSC